jgi:hypothetical protein
MTQARKDAEIAIAVLNRLFISCGEAAYAPGCLSCEARRIRDTLRAMIEDGDIQ